jgi:hypothetical protein
VVELLWCSRKVKYDDLCNMHLKTQFHRPAEGSLFPGAPLAGKGRYLKPHKKGLAWIFLLLSSECQWRMHPLLTIFYFLQHSIQHVLNNCFSHREQLEIMTTETSHIRGLQFSLKLLPPFENKDSNRLFIMIYVAIRTDLMFKCEKCKSW